jgi:hypothetical protein
LLIPSPSAAARACLHTAACRTNVDKQDKGATCPANCPCRLRYLKPRCLGADLGDCMKLLHATYPAEGESPQALRKAIEKVKVSARSWRAFRPILMGVVDPAPSGGTDADAAPREPPQPEPEPDHRAHAGGEFTVEFAASGPIGMSVVSGGEVVDVEPGSAAASAGVLVGDAVQVVNGAATAGLTEIGVKALLQPRPVSVLFVRPVSRVERLGEMTSKWRGKLSTGFSNFGEGKNCRPGTAIAS